MYEAELFSLLQIAFFSTFLPHLSVPLLIEIQLFLSVRTYLAGGASPTLRSLLSSPFQPPKVQHLEER